METADQAVQAGLFGLTLWLKCALVGAAVGAAVAAAQIFPGRWHPAWAQKLIYWFSCPLLAGITCGVLMALQSVPPQSEARAFWLVLCLVIGGFTALITAGALAYLTRNYDPNAVSKAKRASRRPSSTRSPQRGNWDERLRGLFRPNNALEGGQSRPLQQSQVPGTGSSKGPATIPGQKAKLPPERFPVGSGLVKPPHYAGNPREARPSQGKLEKPIK